MITKSFIIKKRDFERKPITIFQHKLRIFLKCYTIKELILNELENNFTFKKTHKINTLIMKDPKLYKGSYTVEEKEDLKNIILTLMI